MLNYIQTGKNKTRPALPAAPRGRLLGHDRKARKLSAESSGISLAGGAVRVLPPASQRRILSRESAAGRGQAPCRAFRHAARAPGLHIASASASVV